MSLHNKPEHNTPPIVEALKEHGLKHDSPSQLADSFRLGYRAALASKPPQPYTGSYLKPEVFGKPQAYVPDGTEPTEADDIAHRLVEMTEERDHWRSLASKPPAGEQKPVAQDNGRAP